MIHNYQQVYLDKRLQEQQIEIASSTIAYFRAPLAGTIKSVKIWAQTTSGAQTAKFSFLKNGVGQFPAPNYIEFASGASFIEKPNLTMAVAVGDVLAFDLIQVSSGGIPAPITFQIEIDDGDTISPAEAYDAVKAIIVPGTNVTETADDTAKTLTIAASGGGGGGGMIQTVIYTTTSLADNAEESGTVTIAKTFKILKIEVSRASRVRVYSTAAYRTADAARVIGEIPSGEHGVIADGNLLADNLILDMMPIPTGTNAEAVRSSSIPIKIQNKSGAVGTVTVTFTFLIIEA